MFKAVKRWVNARAAAAQLQNLSNRELADIGITRAEIHNAVHGRIKFDA